MTGKELMAVDVEKEALRIAAVALKGLDFSVIEDELPKSDRAFREQVFYLVRNAKIEIGEEE